MFSVFRSVFGDVEKKKHFFRALLTPLRGLLYHKARLRLFRLLIVKQVIYH